MIHTGFGHESPHNESKEWYTPPLVFEALGLTFDLDVASPGADKVPWIPAARHLTIVEDGLKTPWSGTVFCNPPYGEDTPAWAKKMAEYRHGIMLVFARMDAAWFQDYAAGADLLCFVRRRIQFIRGDGKRGGSPGAGSLLCAWGQDCVAALLRSRLGVCAAVLRDEEL